MPALACQTGRQRYIGYAYPHGVMTAIHTAKPEPWAVKKLKRRLVAHNTVIYTAADARSSR